MSINIRSFQYKIKKSDIERGKPGKLGENKLKVSDYLLKLGYTQKIISHIKRTDLFLLDKTIYGISINGEKVFTNHLLKEGEILSINIVEDENSDSIEDREMDFSILYEDQDILIVDKSPGIPVHPSIAHRDDTLANAIMHYAHNNLNLDNFIFRAISRIDLGTSGIVLIAKNMLSAAILGKSVLKGEIDRFYLAASKGNVKDQIIEAPINRLDASLIERCVDFENGEYAKTEIKNLYYNKEDDISLIRAKLYTGRTHQIRVHMKYISHPLIGDFLYNPNFSLINRQALHCHMIEFRHPITHEIMSIKAPLPDDIKNLFPEM